MVALTKTDTYAADIDGEKLESMHSIRSFAQLLGKGLEHKARVDLLVAENALGLVPEGVARKAPSSASSI